MPSPSSPDLSLDSSLIVPEHVLVQDFVGELTLLNTTTERYFSLDQVGARVWDAIVQTGTLGEAHARLVEAFEAPPERLHQDLLDLARNLVRTGLLVARPQ